MSLVLKINKYGPIHDWLAEFDLLLKPDWFTPKEQVEPFSPLWTVYSSFGKSKLFPAEWGMNPNWAKKGQIPRALSVARAETVFERVSYKALIKRYRALIPVNGFSARTLNRNRSGSYTLHGFQHQSREALALAALYQFNADGNLQVVLLTKAVKHPELKKSLRMPLLVANEDVSDWLNRGKSSYIENYLENYHCLEYLVLND